MMKKLLKIDELVVRDHFFLSPADNCFYFMEYTAGVGYTYNDTNNLISNFKKSVEYRAHPAWKYKEKAIMEVGSLLRDSLSTIDFSMFTFVQIPPSKTKSNPLYDDRMYRALKLFCEGKNGDVRDLIVVKEDIVPVHEGVHRPTIQEYEDNCFLDKSQCDNLREKIILFDDVVTTGAHFIACRNVIKSYYPDISVYGIFIARRCISNIIYEQ